MHILLCPTGLINENLTASLHFYVLIANKWRRARERWFEDLNFPFEPLQSFLTCTLLPIILMHLINTQS